MQGFQAELYATVIDYGIANATTPWQREMIVRIAMAVRTGRFSRNVVTANLGRQSLSPRGAEPGPKQTERTF